MFENTYVKKVEADKQEDSNSDVGLLQKYGQYIVVPGAIVTVLIYQLFVKAPAPKKPAQQPFSGGNNQRFQQRQSAQRGQNQPGLGGRNKVENRVEEL